MNNIPEKLLDSDQCNLAKLPGFAMVLGAVGVSLSAIAAPAVAQQPVQGEGVEAIEEVVVTAQRRNTTQQDIPAAITVISGDEIENALAFDTQSLQQLSPSLVVSSGQSEAQGSQIRIRGVGTAGGNLGLEGAVGVYINGVYVPRTGIAISELVDLQQVEVLRGPQGTLFGKNTSAGAILLQSARPEFDYSGSARLQVGAGQQNDVDFGRLSGHVTGPLIEDELAFRLAGSVNKRSGYVENVVNGDDVQDRDRFLLRGSMLYRSPNENTQVFAAVDYNEKDETCCAATPFVNGPVSSIISEFGGPVIDAPTTDKVALNTSPTAISDEFGAQVHLDHGFEWADMKVILGYRDFSFDRTQDLDGSPLDVFRRPTFAFESESVSAEVLFSGDFKRVDWLLGFYAFDESLSQDTDSRFGEVTDEFLAARIPPLSGLLAGQFPPGFGEKLAFEQDTDGWSVFTHNVFDITDRFEITVGLRYLEESKSGGGTFDQDSPPACDTQFLIDVGLGFSCPVNDFEADFSTEETVGTAALRYRFTDERSAYISYSTGFKSGGLNFDRTAGGLATSGSTGISTGQTFEPETVDALEVGVRSEWFKKRLRFNATYFYQEIKDLQVNVFDGTTFTVGNRGEVKSRGLEADVVVNPGHGLRLRGGFTYADVTDDGEQIPFAPEWAATGSIFYERPLNKDINGFVNLSARYTDDQVLGGDNDPIKTQEAYTLVNARVGVRLSQYNASINLFARNLSDEEYALVIANAVLQPGSFNQFPGPPRLFGVEIAKDFLR